MNKFFFILLAIILFILVGIAALPSLLSTHWGKQKLSYYIKRVYKIDTACDRLSLSWFGHQEITNLVLDSPFGYHFDCDIIKTEATLLDILFRRTIGHLYFDRPYFEMASHLNPSSKQEKKSPHKQKGKKSASACGFSIPFDGAIICSYGKLLFFSEISPISFDAVQFELANSPEKGAFAHLSCHTLQNEMQGSVHLDASCSQEKSFDVQASVSNLPVTGVDELIALFYPRYAKLAPAALGSNANLSLHASSANELFSLSLSASSPLCHLELAMNTKNGALSLQEPAKLSMTLTPALIESLRALYPLLTPLTLCQNSSIEATLSEFISKNQFQGKIETASPLILAWDQTVVTSNETALEYKKSPEKEELSLHASLITPQGAGSLSAALVKDNIYLTLDLPQIKLPSIELKKQEMLYTLQKPIPFTYKEIKGEIASLSANMHQGYKINAALPTLSYGPVSVHTSELSLDYQPKQNSIKFDFSTHAQGENALSLIGENLSLSFSSNQKTSQLSLSSPLAQIKAPFAVRNGMLTLLGPGKIQWKLTPQGYPILEKMLLSKNSSLTLKEATLLQGSLSSCKLPLTPLDLSQLECSVELSDPSILLWDPRSKESIALSGFATSWKKGKKEEPMIFACELQTKDNLNKTGRLSLQGEYDEKNNINLAFQCKQFPSRLLDIGRENLPFSKILGSYFDASFTTALQRFSGPITATIQSPQLNFSMKGAFSNGVLTLSDSLQAQAKVTREMSQLFLKQVNPLSLSYFYSQDLVRLTIPAKGFSLPCEPFSLEKATIPSARIELGKIACRNEGNINIALDLLKSRQFDNDRELLLWFAPLDLHLAQSILAIERTEILLANTFDIALWGELLLATDDVDMVLGLTAQTLRKAFGIKNLPEDYVLTIPMTGKTDSVKINTGKATAKIALLLAAQQKALTQKGGTGALIGGLLQQMVTLPDNGKVPPAKHPFPWEQKSTKP